MRSRHELQIRREPVLGTLLMVYASATRRSAVAQVEPTLLAEIGRLEAIFSVYRADSELRRWQAADGDVHLSDDLTRLLAVARQWHVTTHGVFNPSVGLLTNRWKRAEAEEVLPSPDELCALAEQIAVPPYEMRGGIVHKTGDCSALNFNAFAKGLIVDLSARHVFAQLRLKTVLVNIGGDLMHLGERGASVAIEDPHRPFDNVEPLVNVELHNGGFATSGSARRGFMVNGTWFSHVIDPRSGQPVDRIASASVKARDAATADVLATVASVIDPAESLAIIDEHGAVGFVVGADRQQYRSARWRDDSDDSDDSVSE